MEVEDLAAEVEAVADPEAVETAVVAVAEDVAAVGNHTRGTI